MARVRAEPGDLIVVRASWVRLLSQPLLRHGKDSRHYMLGSGWVFGVVKHRSEELALVVASIRHPRGCESLDHFILLTNRGVGCIFDDFGIGWTWPGQLLSSGIPASSFGRR